MQGILLFQWVVNGNSIHTQTRTVSPNSNPVKTTC
jgi:hypothetical protein